MNNAQKVILVLGCLVVALMSTVPPWKFVEVGPMTRSETTAGYHPIFSPPAPPEPGFTGTLTGTSMDIPRLAVQWAAAGGVFGALLVLFGIRVSRRTVSRRLPN